MRLATSGDNVGIGINIPAAKLHVVGDLRLNSGGADTRISTGSDSRLSLSTNTSATNSRAWIELWGNDPSRAGELALAGTYLDFRYGSTDTSAGVSGMRMTSEGNLGIGTSIPSSKLHVQGINPLITVDDTSGDSAGIALKRNNADRWRIAHSEGAHYLNFWSSGGPVGTKMVIDDITGNVGLGNYAPTEKITIGGGNLKVSDTPGTKSLRLRTTGSALDLDVSGANLYVNGDDGNIMLVHNTRDNVGIGTTDPTENYRLVVSGFGELMTSAGYFYDDYGGGWGKAYLAGGGIGVQGEASHLGVDGRAATGVRGYSTVGGSAFYAAHGSYDPFTGAHEAKLSDDFPQNFRPGMIVSVTGQAQTRRNEDGEVSISSTLPTVRPSDRANDKAIFGVLAREAPLPDGHWYKSETGERFGTVNALGDGRAWVSNINGNIEAGDYITTSAIPGYGQRQDDDLLHSYTLGKATETVDWDSVTATVEFEGQLIKVYLIAVVYTSG